MWALIINGKVAELTDIDPEGRFHESFEWVAANPEVKLGNAYEDGQFSSPSLPISTPEQIQAAKVAMVQRHLDAAAQALNYDNIITAITYAEEPSVPKFQAEGLAMRTWRSLVWDACYSILEAVENGQRGIPSDSDLIAELPTLEINYEN